MARRRYLSTHISQDPRVNRLAVQGGDFAALLYTWLIPHAEDDATFPADPEEILMAVLPGRRDKTVEDVAAALDCMVRLGLIEVSADPRWLRFPKSFYDYQTYIREERRKTAQAAPPSINKEASAHNSANPRTTAQNGASFSPSFSPSVPSSSSPPTAATQPPGGVAPVADAPDAPHPATVTATALVVYEPDGADEPADAGRDLIWDALEAIFGEVITPSERSARNASVQQFRKGAQRAGLTEAEMARRIGRAHEHWSNVMGAATETPHGLAKHFGALLRGPQVNGRSNGTVQQHTQKVTEFAAIDRGPRKGSAALEDDGYLLSHATTRE